METSIWRDISTAINLQHTQTNLDDTSTLLKILLSWLKRVTSLSAADKPCSVAIDTSNITQLLVAS